MPPGPLPRKPTALLLGKQVPLHDQKDNFYQYMSLAASQQVGGNQKIFTKGKGKKDKDGTLPNIDDRNLLTSPSKGGVLIPEFIDAADAVCRGERGFSAFTRSQNMDIDTQTNFNIIDYEDFKKKRDGGMDNIASNSQNSIIDEHNCICEQLAV